MAETTELVSDSATLRSVNELGFAEKGVQEMRSSDRDNSFVVDIDNLPKSMIMLQRSLSRKAFQQGERKDVTSGGGGCDGVKEESPKAALLLGGSTLDMSVIVEMPPLETEDHIMIPQAKLVANNTESRWKRNGKQRFNSHIDPWRVLFLFATLSSMGTIILIYFTLSMPKLNGDDSSY